MPQSLGRPRSTSSRKAALPIAALATVALWGANEWDADARTTSVPPPATQRAAELTPVPRSADQRTSVITSPTGSSIESYPTVYGQVQDALGGVIVGAKVQVVQYTLPKHRPALDPMPISLFSTRFEVLSDHDGQFALVVPPGRAEIRASAEGYSQEFQPITVPADQVRLALMPEGYISGIVRTPDGVPRAGVEVQALALDDTETRTPAAVFSDQSGSFVIAELGPGQYRLEARGPHHYGHTEAPLELPLGGYLRDVEVRLQTATQLFGNVFTGPDDQPCERGWVRLNKTQDQPDSGGDAAVGAEVRHSVGYQATLSESGGFELKGVRPGRYEVAVHCSGYCYKSGPKQLDLYATQEYHGPVRWEMAQGTALLVHVRDGRARPVTGVSLQLSRGESGHDSSSTTVLVTDEHGDAHVAGLPAGPYQLAAMGEPDAEKAQLILRPGQVQLEQTLHLTGSASLTLHVVNEQGRPIEDEALAVKLFRLNSLNSGPEPAGELPSASSSPPLLATAYGRGSFRASPLVAGDYRVSLSRPLLPADRGALDRVELDRDMERTLVVHVSRQVNMTGQVLDEQGTPMCDAWVTARAASSHGPVASSGRNIEVGGWRALTNAQGNFTLSGLSEGMHYLLNASVEGVGVARAPNVIANGQLVTLRLEPAARLEGKLIDPTGAPVSAIAVQLTHDANDARAGRIIGDGSQFVFDNLSCGKVHLMAIDDHGRIAKSDLVLTQGANPVQVALVVKSEPDGPPPTEVATGTTAQQ